MKHAIIILVVGTILAGCISHPPERPSSYSPDEVYQGYPCTPHCPEFQAGYDQAQLDQLTSINDCGDSLSPYTTGCAAYVNEYLIQNRPIEYGSVPRL